MWALMIERWWFLTVEFPKLRNKIIANWDSRADTTSWSAHRIRDAWVSEASELLNARMLIIKTLVAMCPLIGLLGTVTGMINTFQAITLFGTGDPKLMAGGISQALVTTVLGLVVAIPTLLLYTMLNTRSRGLVSILQEQSTGLIAERAEKAAE